MSGSLRGCHCCTIHTYCCTAVVQGCGWVDRFVPVVRCCGVSTRVRGLFSFLFFFLPLYRPRAGIVQRTTSINVNSPINSRGNTCPLFYPTVLTSIVAAHRVQHSHCSSFSFKVSSSLCRAFSDDICTSTYLKTNVVCLVLSFEGTTTVPVGLLTAVCAALV